MNKIFKIIWSKALGRMVITSELAKQAISQRTSTIKKIGAVDKSQANQLKNHLKPRILSVLALAVMLSGQAWAGSTCDLTPVNVSSSAAGTAALSCGISNQAIDTFGVAVGVSNSAIGKGSTALGSSSAYDDFFFIRTPVVTKNGSGQINSIDGVAVETSAIDIFDLFTNPNFFNLTVNGIDNNSVKSSFLSAVFGGGNIGLGDASSAVGVQNIASGKESSALGYANGAHGVQSSAVGRDNTASGHGSNALGDSNKARGQNSLATGTRALALQTGATAVGGASGGNSFNPTNDAGNTKIIAINGIPVTATTTNPNSITAINGVAVTVQDVSDFISSLQHGGSVAFGENSTAVGSQNIAAGSSSNALGYSNTASALSSSALGYGNIASGAGSGAVKA
jgi:hypothetical protein